MATDKASMKLRLQKIGKIVGTLTFQRKSGTPFQQGYRAGQEDLAEDIRKIMNNPIEGHHDSPDYEAKREFLEQTEELALRRWKSMSEEERAKFTRREILLSGEGDRESVFQAFADEVAEVHPFAHTTYCERVEDKEEFVRVVSLYNNEFRTVDLKFGQTLVTIGLKMWAK